jgi:hypothetical protein
MIHVVLLYLRADAVKGENAIVCGEDVAVGKKRGVFALRELCLLADAVDVDENVCFSVDVHADSALG